MATSLRVRCCRRMEHTLTNFKYMEILAIWERANNFFAKKCELSTYQQFVHICKVYRILGACWRDSTRSSALQNWRTNIGCFDRTPVVKSSNFFRIVMECQWKKVRTLVQDNCEQCIWIGMECENKQVRTIQRDNFRTILVNPCPMRIERSANKSGKTYREQFMSILRE